MFLILQIKGQIPNEERAARFPAQVAANGTSKLERQLCQNKREFCGLEGLE